MSETDRRLFERLLWGTRGRPYHTDERDPAVEEPTGDRPLPALVPESEPTESDIRRQYAKGLALLHQVTEQKDTLAAQLEAEREESDARQAYMEEVRAERDTLAAQLDAEKSLRYEYISKGQAAHVQLVAERDALAQQLQQAQADLSRARENYEADVLRLIGERDDARMRLRECEG